ncbi:hypothetical protein MMC22_011553 [Lobaria immixta]|nr:hypothetical protein [Lobaria immixta]
MPANETYDPPDSYDNLDELRVPSPLEHSPNRQCNWERVKAEGSKDTDHVKPSRASQEGSYDEPASYSNLEEVKGPSPVSSHRSHFLEDLYSNLEEVKGPSPVSSHRSHFLEDLSTALDNGPEGTKDAENGELGVCHTLRTYSPRRTSRLHSPDQSDDQSKPFSPGHGRASRLATQLYTVSYLIFFSILGTLARLGLQALTFYPGAPVQTGVLWANFAGSFIMGFLLEDRKLFRDGWGGHPPMQQEERNSDDGDSRSTTQRYTAAAKKEHAAVKKTIPLYIGLSTGFCGSFTSFSSFMRDAYLALSNALPAPIPGNPAAAAGVTTIPRNPGYGFLAVCAVIIVTTILCLGAFKAGAHLALTLKSLTPSISSRFTRQTVDRTVVFLAWGSWLGAVIMTVWPPDRPGASAGQSTWGQENWRGKALFALVFAPLGCLLRFYAALRLNGRVPWFPLGTFAVNMFGTALEGMFFDLQHVPIGNVVGCQVLQGAMDGFCGCLTTVSTWVAEVHGLRNRHAYFYGLVSVGLGLGLAVVIMGSLQWTDGFHRPLCAH